VIETPAAKNERCRERAPDIRFFSLDQIDQQGKSLEENPDLQVIVAVYVYARLRRENLCWLQESDVDCSAGIPGMTRVRAKAMDVKSWKLKTAASRVAPISVT
jgi:hypothetical protein